MSKWYKPQLNEVGSVWLGPSAEMARELSANKENVLGKLRFYCAHGRPEDFNGKFKDQVRTYKEEILSEIVGVLTLAASLSVKLRRGVLIATLEKVLINPALIYDPTFHPAVAWCLAQFYQRKEEKPGTYWPDIMGERFANFPGRRRKPGKRHIKAAASSALEFLRTGRTPGRPPNFAIDVLAKKLGDIFRHYNPKITRHSLYSLPRQIDGGPFFEFLEAVLKPLQAYLRANRLPSVSASTVARRAVEMQGKKITWETIDTLFHP
jgi:hypothetical protein